MLMALILSIGCFFISNDTVSAFSLKDALGRHGTGAGTPGFMPGTHDKYRDSTKSVTTVTQKIINVVVYLAGVIAVFFVVFNAGKLVLQGGDDSELGNAKKGFIWAAVGLGVIIFSYVIVKTIVSLTYSGEGV